MKRVAIIIATSLSAPAAASTLEACAASLFHFEYANHRVVADGVVAWTKYSNGSRGGFNELYVYNCEAGKGASAIAEVRNLTSRSEVVLAEKRVDDIFRGSTSREWDDLVEEFRTSFVTEKAPINHLREGFPFGSPNQICGCVAAFPEMLGDGEPSHLGDRNDRT